MDMAGLYIHIPFCKQACFYCNFHFSTVLRLKSDLLKAILTELELRRNYLGGLPLSSVYLGGGTPSLLEAAELVALFKRIEALFPVQPNAEITLEANPDDLTKEKLYELRQYTPINRLSIGVQSFFDADLQWMNRVHNAQQALNCISNAQALGFSNLTIDLIYGLPESPDTHWEENLRLAFSLEVPHLSCYCLTIEEGTALAHFVRSGKSKPVDEERAARQFEYLMDEAERHGYEHYEISNFARPSCYARHNSSYWLGEPYLGVGPSAHSFDGVSRQWNIANNALYIKAIEENRIPAEREVLSLAQRYNEYVMTHLRTMWGCCSSHIAKHFGSVYLEYFEKQVQPFIALGQVHVHHDTYSLTRAGKLLADRIASALFWVE
ncbi:MAG: radical SAM family heme chaperone HemW [Saprospiraceae bacterium]|nr:radical SAM family heme chaperone HemW [Saprospiraceae bacterium]MDW8484632.1 radical SAM family heme chaperone HemW [Saprospiraceae bacterium]